MITIMFTCKRCGLTKQEVQVPARTIEDVCEWGRQVGQMAGEEHNRISPACPSQQVDLYIPTPPQAEFIGQQIE